MKLFKVEIKREMYDLVKVDQYVIAESLVVAVNNVKNLICIKEVEGAEIIEIIDNNV